MEDNECVICLDQIKLEANVNSCAHKFCFACIQSWSKVTNCCPVCKAEFTQIKYSPAQPEPPKAPDPVTEDNGKGKGKGKKRKAAPAKKVVKQKVVKVARKVQHVGYEETGFSNPVVLNRQMTRNGLMVGLGDEDDDDDDDDDFFDDSDDDLFDDDDDEEEDFMRTLGFRMHFGSAINPWLNDIRSARGGGRYCRSCACMHYDDNDDDDDDIEISDTDEIDERPAAGRPQFPRTVLDLCGDVPVFRQLTVDTVGNRAQVTGRNSGRLRDAANSSGLESREVIDLVDSSEEDHQKLTTEFLESSTSQSRIATEAINSSSPPADTNATTGTRGDTTRTVAQPSMPSRPQRHRRQQNYAAIATGTAQYAPRALTAQLRRIIDRS